jgi:hypothetical protein
MIPGALLMVWKRQNKYVTFVAPLLTRVLLLRESTFGVLLSGTEAVGSDIGVPIPLYRQIICSWIPLYKGLGRGKGRGYTTIYDTGGPIL